MIKYALICSAGHRFEAWFRDSGSADAQLSEGLAACPICGTVEVRKSVMAPAVAAGRRRREEPAAPASDAPAAGAALASKHAPAPSRVGDAGPTGERAPAVGRPSPPLTPEALRRAARAHLAAVRAHVEANAENVGPRFAEEARAIHEGDAEERAIWGECSVEEAIELAEDGVPCAPLPPVEPLDD